MLAAEAVQAVSRGMGAISAAADDIDAAATRLLGGGRGTATRKEQTHKLPNTRLG